MKCLRCGTCCFYFVVVIKPEYVSGELNVDLLTEDMLLALDGTKQCPHLEWQEDGRAFCKIHHYDWFIGIRLVENIPKLNRKTMIVEWVNFSKNTLKLLKQSVENFVN